MRVCLKSNRCPRRISIGKSKDPDTISYVCSSCKGLYYHSAARTRTWVLRLVIVIAALVVIGSIVAIDWRSLIGNAGDDGKARGPDDAIIDLFTYINLKDYQKAYELTDNQIWKPFSNFKSENVWGAFNNISLSSIQPKSYASAYGADTILNVKYWANLSNSGSIAFNYDYHLKRNPEWKIVRMIDPLTDFYDPIIYSGRIRPPETSVETVERFIEYINDQQLSYAHWLTLNPEWGNYERFRSRRVVWSDVAIVEKHDLTQKQEGSRYGTDIIELDYTMTNYDGIVRRQTAFFHTRETKYGWKITRLTQ